MLTSELESHTNAVVDRREDGYDEYHRDNAGEIVLPGDHESTAGEELRPNSMIAMLLGQGPHLNGYETHGARTHLDEDGTCETWGRGTPMPLSLVITPSHVSSGAIYRV